MAADPERDFYCMQMSTKQPKLQAAGAGSQDLILKKICAYDIYSGYKIYSLPAFSNGENNLSIFS